MTPNEFRIRMLILAIIGVIILLSVSIYLVIINTQNHQCPTSSCPTSTCPPCHTSSCPPCPTPYTMQSNRDRRVLDDPLYPPLNRTDDQTFNSVVREMNQGNLSRNHTDSFRLVGYLSCTDPMKDAGGGNWKLMARMKDRQQGEYYIIPTNNNIDVKIPLTPDIMVGEKLKDVFSIPNEMRFHSPMLSESVYQYTEIPKADFTSPMYL